MNFKFDTPSFQAHLKFLPIAWKLYDLVFNNSKDSSPNPNDCEIVYQYFICM